MNGLLNREATMFDSIEEKVIFSKLSSNSSFNNRIKKDQINNNSETEKYLQEMSEFWSEMDKTRENYAYRILYSKHEILGKIIIFIKKVIRKLLKWYIEPICFQQTSFNNSVTRMAGRIIEIQRSLYIQQSKNEEIFLNKLVEQKNKFNDDLEIKFNKENLKMNELNDKVIELERLFSDSNKQLAEANNLDKLNNTLENLENIYNKNNLKINDLNNKVIELENLLNFSNNKLAEANNKIKVIENLNLDNFNKTNTLNNYSVAQAGEDRILANFLYSQNIPFDKCSYLDIGANHAIELSNTYYFYRQNSRGVLVEANPLLIPELKLYRSEDIIINKCIDIQSDKNINFYVLNSDGLSTAKKDTIDELISKDSQIKINNVYQINTVSVNDLMEKYFIDAPTILSIDIEGMEIEVLKSIDFEKFRPLVVVLEMIPYDIKLPIGQKNMEILDFMVKRGYIEYAFTGINSIFIDEKKLAEDK
jgi:FkbM family methyltransferase